MTIQIIIDNKDVTFTDRAALLIRIAKKHSDLTNTKYVGVESILSALRDPAFKDFLPPEKKYCKRTE